MAFGWLRYLVEELRFVKSADSFLNLYHKLPFLMQKLADSPCRTTEVPLSLQVELTNRCNIHCTSCPRDSITRQKGYIELPLLRKIIDDAAATGVKRVHLYLHGEPLLHPRILEILGYVKMKRMAISLATNGMLLDRKLAESILSCGLNNSDHIMFSLMGFSKEVHEEIMRGVAHGKVVQNIRDLLDVREKVRSNGPLIEVVMYSMAENLHERAEFVKFWQGVVDHVRLVDNVSAQYARFGTEGAEMPVRKDTCKDLWQRMTVLWNGDVTVCCADVNGCWIIGNLRDSSIAELWGSEALSCVRKLHKEKRFHELPMCAHCDW